MRAIRQFMLFYFVGIILFLLIAACAGAKLMPVVISPYFWIIPAVFNAFGFLIALVVYELKLRPIQKKTGIFRIGYLIGLTGMLALLVFAWYSSPSEPHPSPNSDKNHDVMKYFVNDNEEYIRLAFNRLESEFKNRDDFRLFAFSVRKVDTIVNGFQDTVYNVYFTYHLAGDNDNKYFSKVSVLGNTPMLRIYNLDTKTSVEYLGVYTEARISEREAMQSLKESFQEMPDSTRKAILDAIKETLNE